MSDPLNQIELISMLSVPRYATRLKPTPIPTARWDADPLYCLKVNDQWISHILGVMIALDQPDTWIGTPDEIYDARQQVNEIMVAFMEQCDPMSNCCPEPLTRITDDGTLQVSYDGGMTWQDATTEDPRNTAPQLPPPGGANGNEKRCSAANNVLGQFKDGISTFEGYFDTAGTLVAFVTAVAGFIAAVIFAPEAIPIIVGALIALLSGVWAAGKSAYSSAFDDTIFGDLLCILYCNCPSSGVYTDANFAQIRADISSHFTTEIDGFFIARDAFLALLNGVTTVGLNTMARIPTGSSASCDSCGCDDCTNLGAWSIQSYNGHNVGIEATRGDNFIVLTGAAHPDFGTPWNAIIKTPDSMSCCKIMSIEELAGDGADYNYFHIECGNSQWPSGVFQHPAGIPEPTSSNQIFIRKDSGSNFTVKITFGSP